MNTATNSVKVPYLLSFGATIPGTRFRDLVPGRGEAGWSVMVCPTASDAAEWMRAHAFAAMPCWRNPDGLGALGWR